MAAPSELRRFFSAALVTPVTDAVPEPPDALRRRRVVAGLTLVAGAGVMAWALRIPPGDALFYPATAALAAVWFVGALASGPLHRGRARTRSGRTDAAAVVQSLALAALLLGIFALGALVVARIPALADSVQRLLDHARVGSLVAVAALTALNGVAEELYFRGALFAAVPARHAVAVTTIAYALTVVPTGIGLLVLAAAALGLVTGLQRRVTGGVLGPAVTHVTWSLGMLLVLPQLLT
ncbi:type II CAAX prenyl endopeptidase Rce1 family protein [Miniimonas sp. S16]|uniref:CPBP family glutamic-type intramembrane protease n=1 Tax=Miniimonas sp. S16 TaxID=2171623 RepID=UPI000D529F8E|nr:CPBP family glutamic-type intramembrane protease [Miniimonas sp. S16]